MYCDMLEDVLADLMQQADVTDAAAEVRCRYAASLPDPAEWDSAGDGGLRFAGQQAACLVDLADLCDAVRPPAD